MMALSSKRPSQRDEIKTKLLNDVIETNEKKRRLNAEIEDSLLSSDKGAGCGRRPNDIQHYPRSVD